MLDFGRLIFLDCGAPELLQAMCDVIAGKGPRSRVHHESVRFIEEAARRRGGERPARGDERSREGTTDDQGICAAERIGARSDDAACDLVRLRRRAPEKTIDGTRRERRCPLRTMHGMGSLPARIEPRVERRAQLIFAAKKLRMTRKFPESEGARSRLLS
jgi:hypothetical protein